jgi:hypothetical protein
MSPDRVSGIFCDGASDHWRPLSGTPEEMARQLAATPGLVHTGRIDSAARFGHPTAHLAFTVPRLCPKYGDVLLWGLDGAEHGSLPGVVNAIRPGQRYDAWLVDVDGSRVVVWTEAGPGVPRTWRAQAERIVESLLLERVR